MSLIIKNKYCFIYWIRSKTKDNVSKNQCKLISFSEKKKTILSICTRNSTIKK